MLDMMPIVDLEKVLDELAKGPPTEWPRGMRTPPPERVWLIDSGVIEEWRGDVLLATRAAGDLVGELELTQPPPGIDKHPPTPYSTSWMVRSGTRVRQVDEARLKALLAEGGPTGTLLWDQIMSHGRLWRSTAGHAFDRFAWARLPEFEHLPKPPPYQMPGGEVFLLPVSVPPAITEQLPPFLQAQRTGDKTEDPAFGLIILRTYPAIWAETEDEPAGPRPGITQVLVALLVNEEGSGRSSLYVPWLFSNNALSMFIGREVFGMPAMFGSLYVQKDDEQEPTHIHLIGSAGGERSFDLTLDKATPEELQQNKEGLLFPSAAAVLARSMLRNGVALTAEEQHAFVKTVSRLAFGEPARVAKAAFSLRQLAWKRNFRPTAKAAERVPWDPEDFSVDALAASYLSFESDPERPPEMWLLDKVAVDAGFALLLEGTFHNFKPVSNLVMRAEMDVRWEAALDGAELPYELDYKAMVRRLLDTPDGKELDKLDWGPAVWGDRSKLPKAAAQPPLPHLPWHRRRRPPAGQRSREAPAVGRAPG